MMAICVHNLGKLGFVGFGSRSGLELVVVVYYRYFAHNCCTASLSWSVIYPYW